jgi:hypothetical protein
VTRNRGRPYVFVDALDVRSFRCKRRERAERRHLSDLPLYVDSRRYVGRGELPLSAQSGCAAQRDRVLDPVRETGVGEADCSDARPRSR